jgi:hypothetical protein
MRRGLVFLSFPTFFSLHHTSQKKLRKKRITQSESKLHTDLRCHKRKCANWSLVIHPCEEREKERKREHKKKRLGIKISVNPSVILFHFDGSVIN